MRHGKAKGRNAGERDFDRRLHKRGLLDATRMGEVILEKGWTPDLIVSSSAERAAMTADAVAQACGYSGKILQMESLYLGTAEQYIRVLEELGYEEDERHVGDEEGCVCFERIMMIGHQPVLSHLVHEMTGQSVDMVTGAVAVIGFGIESWSEISNGGTGRGRLVDICLPSDVC